MRKRPYLTIDENNLVNDTVTALKCYFWFFCCAGYDGNGGHEAVM